MNSHTPGLFLLKMMVLISTYSTITARTTDCELRPKTPGDRFTGCLSTSCMRTLQGLILPSTCLCPSTMCEKRQIREKQAQITQVPQGPQVPIPQSPGDLIRAMQIFMMNMDIDECMMGIAKCNQVCVNTFGSYICRCWTGYSLNEDGKTCSDVNECITGDHSCSQQCKNTVGSYRCGCPRAGYQLDSSDGRTCRDVNECITGEHTCNGPMQRCANTIGSFRCLCPNGYELSQDGSRCDDVNECLRNIDGCEQQCINTVGWYICRCNNGFELSNDGMSCNGASIIENNEMQ